MGVGVAEPAATTGKAVKVMRGTGDRKAWRTRNIFGEADLTIHAVRGERIAQPEPLDAELLSEATASGS